MSWAHLKHIPDVLAFNEYGAIQSRQKVKFVYLQVSHGLMHWIHFFVAVKIDGLTHESHCVEDAEHVKHYDAHG